MDRADDHPGGAVAPVGSTFRETLRRFASHGLVYVAGTFTIRAVGLFVLVPVYTRYLPEHEYGILGILTLVTQVVMAFLSLGLMNAMFRHWAGEKEPEARRRLISTTVWSHAVMLVVGSAIFLLNPSWWSRVLLGSPEWGRYVLLAVATALFDMFSAVPLGVVRMEERPGFFTGVMLVRTVVSTALAVWLVAWRNAGIAGVLVANLIGTLAAFAMIVPLIVQRCGWVVDAKLLREMLPFGLTYTVSATATLFLTMGDRYVVKFVIGLAAVGVYTLGQQLAGTINMLGQSFVNAYQPLALKRDRTVDGGRFVTKTFTYFAFGLTWVGLGFSLLSREVVLILARNPGYHPALTVVPLLVLAAILYVLSITMEVGFFFAGRARYIALPTIIGVGVIIGLSFAFVPIFGIFGAAIAAALAAGTRLALMYFWGQRVYPLPYDMGRLVLVLLVAGGAHVVLLVPGPWWALVSLKVVVALLFPLMVWSVGFFTPYEQGEIRRVVRSTLRSAEGHS